MNNNSQRPPIFIVGSPRSGTTLLRLIMDSHPNISCGPETKFLTEFKKVTSNYWDTVKNFGFERTYWYEKTADYFNAFQQEYLQKRGKKRWAEKTPGYTINLDYINCLFPNSQIIHIIRDGRDVVASHRDRWGYKSALNSIDTWKKYVKMARDFGKNLPKDRYFELRYEDLVTQTEPQLRALFEYLQESWDPIVLKYNEVPHDVADVYQKATDERRKIGKDSSLIYSSQVGSGQQKLDMFLKFRFNQKAGDLLRELGYQ
jgi:hypothetical protein